jgi:NADH:ubiquinone oxidoreductase subunit H
MFFLAEYANMILVSMLASLMFLGGWLPPMDRRCSTSSRAGSGCGLKAFVVVTMFLWVRATFPRLPLRPDHAPGLEDLHPGHPGVAGGRGRCGCQSPFNIWK